MRVDWASGMAEESDHGWRYHTIRVLSCRQGGVSGESALSTLALVVRELTVNRLCQIGCRWLDCESDGKTKTQNCPRTPLYLSELFAVECSRNLLSVHALHLRRTLSTLRGRQYVRVSELHDLPTAQDK